jgi:cytochrome c peroxidase
MHRAAAGLIALLAAASPAGAGEFSGAHGVLPAGTEIDSESLWQPRELFHSEAIHGSKSYLVNLGDLAFSSPSLLGGAARQAGMSCASCHVNGAGNQALFVPGMSGVPGTFDTTGPLFNPKANNGVLDPVTVPSLRGARLNGPYGHDGREASLRDFVRNVIVVEFSGPEPAPEILDALVTYIRDIDVLPNRRLGPDGKLTGPTSAAERRGEALFYKPFRQNPELSCAGCHVPTGGFVDHKQHDVGSSGLFKTPTLLNANFNAPFFHDGRYAGYDEVVMHFDRVFYLGLSAQDRRDLATYLRAIGDGEEPYVRDGVDTRFQEIDDFVSVLDTAIPDRNAAVIGLTVTTVGGELRELTEMFPERRDAVAIGGDTERLRARGALKRLVLALARVGSTAGAGDFAMAAAALIDYRAQRADALPLLKAAEPWSLFDPKLHEAHFAAVRALNRAAIDPALMVQRRFDND